MTNFLSKHWNAALVSTVAILVIVSIISAYKNINTFLQIGWLLSILGILAPFIHLYVDHKFIEEHGGQERVNRSTSFIERITGKAPSKQALISKSIDLYPAILGTTMLTFSDSLHLLFSTSAT